MKIKVFWDVIPCILAGIYRRPILLTLKMEAARSPRTLGSIYQITQRHIPEYNNHD
jgi:hypothetical protein